VDLSSGMEVKLRWTIVARAISKICLRKPHPSYYPATACRSTARGGSHVSEANPQGHTAVAQQTCGHSDGSPPIIPKQHVHLAPHQVLYRCERFTLGLVVVSMGQARKASLDSDTPWKGIDARCFNPWGVVGRSQGRVMMG
jgi:hypothetical protein